MSCSSFDSIRGTHHHILFNFILIKSIWDMYHNRHYAYDVTPSKKQKCAATWAVNRITRKSSCQKCASRTSAYKTMALTPDMAVQ